VPHYDRPTATCSNVYCHGGGIALAADTTVGVNHAPVWTATGGLGCGAACHGSPPAFSPHLPTMTRLDCSSCHPRTVDPSGVVIISGPPGAETSAHINGVLDVAE
jgi:predicted CxxxxCH...CXXCH cytochrome family protein